MKEKLHLSCEVFFVIPVMAIHALGKIMGISWENFVFSPKYSHFFLKMGELFPMC